MQYRQLGKTDLNVSRICFGCWQLSPKFWGDISIDEWRGAVLRALETGVNFIDTADAYGDGEAETELGKFMAAEKLRGKFVLATKFYWNFTQSERFPDTRHDHIIQACEDSLRRLQTDVIDLYQIHAWDALTRPDEVAAALLRLKKEGKVRWFGVSNLNVEQMRLYNRHFPVDCLQPPFSLLAREIEARELPYCLDNRIGVIAYSPLYRGLLTGKYKPDHVFEDSRAKTPYFYGKPFHHLLNGIGELGPLAEKHGLSIPQLAIRWVLTHPALTSAIVGIKNADHVATITKAAEAVLPQDDWHRAAGIIANAKAGADKLLAAGD